MSNPTKIDRQFFRNIRPDIDEALAAVAEKHGVSMDLGRASYSYTNGKITVNIAALSNDGEALTPEREALNLLGERHGIRHGMTFFTRDGNTYTVEGWNTRARKRPVHCRRESNGKTYVFPVADVARLINAQQDKQKGGA